MGRRIAVPRNVLFFLSLLLLLLLHFQLLRAGLMLRNRANADGATADIARSFLTGARFDLATACYLLAPFALAAYLPKLSFNESRRHRRLFLAIFLSLMSVLTFTCLAEFEFFHEFQTRFNQVALQYLNEPTTVGGMVWYGYPVVRYVLLWAAWCAALSAGVWWLMRAVYRESSSKPQAWAEVAGAAALVAVLVLGMRGGLQSEPLRWGDAFTSRNEFANQMGLNGLYTLGNTVKNNLSGKNTSSQWSRRMPLEDARQVARGMVVEPDETLIDPADRTLLRRDSGLQQSVTLAPPSGGRRPNVVLVLMESFSARFMGAVGAPHSFTPNLDAIAHDGVLFRRAFSSGTHTHQGVFSTLLGFPNLPGYEYLMENYTGNQSFSSLPSILHAQGYQTLFLYNGNLAWDNMEGFFRKQGIDRFVGGRDFGPGVKNDRVWGVSDKDLLDRANQEFERAHRSGPFFGFVLTLSNHAPFDLPQPLPFQRTSGMGELDKRLDGLRYADWAIGQFIEQAKKLSYFNETLFVFMGDHGFHVPPKLTDANLTYHHVPLVLYAPALLSQRGLALDMVVNQVNVAPAILGLLGVETPTAHWARNVFEPGDFSDDNFAVFKGSGGARAVALARGDRLLVVGDDGKPRLYRYDLGFAPSVTPLESTSDAATAAAMRRELEGYVQSAIVDLSHHVAGPLE